MPHVPIPGAFEYELSLLLCSMVHLTLKLGDHLCRLKAITWALKSIRFSLDKGRSESERKLEVWEGLKLSLLPWKWSGLHEKKCRQPLGAENGPQLAARRKWGCHSYNLKGMNSEKAWKWILPQSLQARSQPGWNLDFSVTRFRAEDPAEPTRTSDLHSGEIINGCILRY